MGIIGYLLGMFVKWKLCLLYGCCLDLGVSVEACLSSLNVVVYSHLNPSSLNWIYLKAEVLMLLWNFPFCNSNGDWVLNLRVVAWNWGKLLFPCIWSELGEGTFSLYLIIFIPSPCHCMHSVEQKKVKSVKHARYFCFLELLLLEEY